MEQRGTVGNLNMLRLIEDGKKALKENAICSAFSLAFHLAKCCATTSGLTLEEWWNTYSVCRNLDGDTLCKLESCFLMDVDCGLFLIQLDAYQVNDDYFKSMEHGICSIEEFEQGNKLLVKIRGLCYYLFDLIEADFMSKSGDFTFTKAYDRIGGYVFS